MFCANCGQRLDDDAKFCFNCGASTGEQATPVSSYASAPTPNYNATTVLPNQARVNTTYVPKQENTAVSRLKASNHSPLMIIAMVLYSVVLVNSVVSLIDSFDNMNVGYVGLVESIVLIVLKVLFIVSMAQIAVMLAGLWTNFGCSLTSHGMNTTGVLMLKIAVIIRMVLRVIFIIAILVCFFYVLDAYNEKLRIFGEAWADRTEYIATGVKMARNDMMTLCVVLFVAFELIIIVPLIQEFFILSALKSMRITAKTETLRLKGYTVVYAFNYFFIGVKVAALIIIPIVASILRGMAYDTGNSSLINLAQQTYNEFTPDVWAIVIRLCSIAALVLFSINSSKYQKESKMLFDNKY